MAKQDKKGGLGRGLDALWGDVPAIVEEKDAAVESIQNISIHDIDPNREQARKYFDAEQLEELSASIAAQGIIQPLILKKNGERYTIIAGERRWRAARMAGLTEVPAIIRDYDQQKLAEVSLIENLQRSDLNPVEEAAGIRQLMDQYNLTQEEIAEKLGKSRPSIANSLRLLQLPEEVLLLMRDGVLSAGHGKCIAGLKSPETQIKVAKEIEEKSLSVRQTEELCKALTEERAPAERKTPRRGLSPELNDVQSTLQAQLGTKVNLQGTERRGKIVIEYYSKSQLEQLYEYLRK